MPNKIAAFKASFPALFGYIALGISFGFLFQKAGGNWYLATLMSILVYAGAAQFVAITLLLNHAGLLSILSATLFINLRHIFYGLSFLDRFPDNFFKKAYMIFGLSDEAYSILSVQKNRQQGHQFNFYVILFSHGYWILGSLIGALLADYLTIDLSFLGFSLTALFIVLAFEQIIVSKQYKSLLIAAIAILIALIFFNQQMLVAGLAIATIILLGYYPLEKKHE